MKTAFIALLGLAYLLALVGGQPLPQDDLATRENIALASTLEKRNIVSKIFSKVLGRNKKKTSQPVRPIVVPPGHTMYIARNRRVTAFPNGARVDRNQWQPWDGNTKNDPWANIPWVGERPDRPKGGSAPPVKPPVVVRPVAPKPALGPKMMNKDGNVWQFRKGESIDPKIWLPYDPKMKNPWH